MVAIGMCWYFVKSVAPVFTLSCTSGFRENSRVSHSSYQRKGRRIIAPVGIYPTDYPRLLDSCGRETRTPECKINTVEN